MSSGRMTRRRRWPRFVGAALSSVALAGGVKLGTMYWFAEAGTREFGGGHFAASETNFARLQTLNLIAPSRAHVGVGDARYRQNDLMGAETAFARALRIDPGDCRVRFNLAVTIEAQGDVLVSGERLTAADEGQPFDPGVARRADPIERYSLALSVAEGQPCPSRSPDDVGDRLAATRDRLDAKLAALEGASTDDEREDPQSPTNDDRGDSEEIDNLQLRNESGAGQREEARDQDSSGAVPDGQSNW